MRAIAALAVGLTLFATTPQAHAGKCYVDSDCPTGMICNSAGGCEVPSGSGGGSGGGGGASSTKLIVYGVILTVVIVALLVPAIQANQEAQQLRLLPAEPRQPAAGTCGLTITF